MYNEDYTFWRVKEVVDRKVGHHRLDYALSHRDLVTIAVSGFAAHPTFRQVRTVFLSEDGQLLCHRSFWWYDHFEEGEQLCLLDGTPDASKSSGGGRPTESTKPTSTIEPRALRVVRRGDVGGDQWVDGADEELLLSDEESTEVDK